MNKKPRHLRMNFVVLSMVLPIVFGACGQGDDLAPTFQQLVVEHSPSSGRTEKNLWDVIIATIPYLNEFKAEEISKALNMSVPQGLLCVTSHNPAFKWGQAGSVRVVLNGVGLLEFMDKNKATDNPELIMEFNLNELKRSIAYGSFDKHQLKPFAECQAHLAKLSRQVDQIRQSTTQEEQQRLLVLFNLAQDMARGKSMHFNHAFELIPLPLHILDGIESYLKNEVAEVSRQRQQQFLGIGQFLPASAREKGMETAVDHVTQFRGWLKSQTLPGPLFGVANDRPLWLD